MHMPGDTATEFLITGFCFLLVFFVNISCMITEVELFIDAEYRKAGMFYVWVRLALVEKWSLVLVQC